MEFRVAIGQARATMSNRSKRVTQVGGALLLVALSSAACSRPPSAPQPAAAPPPLAEMTPVVSVKELMAHMIDPASDHIFDAVWWDGTASGMAAHLPQTEEDWEKVRIGAVTLAEGIELLKVPRAFAPAGDVNDSLGPNPPELSPTEIKARIDKDPVLWVAKIQALRNVGLETLEVVKNKDTSALWEASGHLDQACEACHLEYWYPKAAVVRGATVPAASAPTLVGAIDFHAHGDPDGTARKIDVIDLARAAKAAGMRAIVIKNHYEPTASLAYIVRKEVPGIEVFGGISLDLTVGGVNPAAVEWMTRVKGAFGKVIWLPTFDSESQVKLDKRNRPFVSVIRDGKILPEVLQVIGLAAKHDLVLETGHSAPRESLMLIAEAKRQGVAHVLVTHAMTNPGGPLSLEEMRQAATLGALLELVYSPLTDVQLQKEADAIRAIGAASFVLSSDLGQPQNPLHTDGLLAMYKGLMTKGISAADIDLMSRRNPARLLGLER